ncbi:hypothetical protein MPDQ_000817 [Monascus purpureus]|uniref:Uncharacterized protein n=1 Tax=Monascus purpureus TaxID=5098 RepID=A0A507QQQ5_MONPU|nr:hypothetical protein MPDQ_000817 [Monascus purpureus]
MAAIASYLIVLIVARTVHPHAGKWSRFGLWTAVNGLAVGYHPIHSTWVQLNCTDPRERSIAIARVITVWSNAPLGSAPLDYLRNLTGATLCFFHGTLESITSRNLRGSEKLRSSAMHCHAAVTVHLRVDLR